MLSAYRNAARAAAAAGQGRSPEVWHVAERVLRRVALVHPTHGAVGAGRMLKRNRYDYSALPWHVSRLVEDVISKAGYRTAFHSRFAGRGYGSGAVYSTGGAPRAFSSGGTGGNGKDPGPGPTPPAAGASAASPSTKPLETLSYSMGSVDAAQVRPPKGWQPPSLTAIPGLGAVQNVRSLRDLMDVYPPLEGYLMAQLHMRDQQQFRTGLAAVLGGLGLILFLFWKEVTDSFANNTGQVAADIVAHEELQMSLSELVSAVSTALLSDGRVQNGTAAFGAKFLADPYIRDSTAALLVWALQSDSVRDSLLWLLRHPETLAATNVLFADVLASETTQASARDLVYWVIQQPEVMLSVQQMFVTLFNTQTMMDEGAKYMMYGAHETMDDPGVIDHCSRLTQQVLEDPRVQKQGGDTFWAALQWSLSPSAVFGDADANAQALADQRLKDMKKQAAVRAELAALKAKVAEEEAAKAKAAALAPVPGITPDMQPAA